MRLTRSTPDGRGIVRKRRGKGFAYYGPDGELLDDPEAERHGLATLLCEHVTVRSRAVVFDYPAKSGVQRYIEIDDPEVVRSVRSLVRQGGRPDRLFVCRNGSGDDWIDLRADDVNARFKELVGDEFTIKDLRTWHGTVLAAAAFAAAKEPTSPTRVKKEASAVMKEVAAELGNTPAVARKSYVDPRVVDGYAHGMTISSAVKRAAKSPPDEGQAILEKATRTLIRRVAKG